MGGENPSSTHQFVGFGFVLASSSPSHIRAGRRHIPWPFLVPLNPMEWLSSAPGSLGNPVEVIHDCSQPPRDLPAPFHAATEGTWERHPWCSCSSLVNPHHRYCENHCCSPKGGEISAGEQGSLLQLLLQMVCSHLCAEVLVPITPGTTGTCCPGPLAWGEARLVRICLPWGWEPVSGNPQVLSTSPLALCHTPCPVTSEQSSLRTTTNCSQFTLHPLHLPCHRPPALFQMVLPSLER